MKNNWKNDFEKLCKHEYTDCAAHGEGQDCCLDTGHFRNNLVLDFIESLLAEQKKELMEEIKNNLPKTGWTTNPELHLAIQKSLKGNILTSDVPPEVVSQITLEAVGHTMKAVLESLKHHD